MEADQRKTKRIASHLPLRYWVIKDQKKKKNPETLDGISHDISEGGICIKADRVPVENPLEIGKNIIGMEIDLFPHFKNIKVFGEPKWCDNIKEKEKPQFHIGIKFLDLEEGNHKVLQRYLENSHL